MASGRSSARRGTRVRMCAVFECEDPGSRVDVSMCVQSLSESEGLCANFVYLQTNLHTPLHSDRYRRRSRPRRSRREPVCVSRSGRAEARTAQSDRTSWRPMLYIKSPSSHPPNLHCLPLPTRTIKVYQYICPSINCNIERFVTKGETQLTTQHLSHLAPRSFARLPKRVVKLSAT